MVKYIKRIVKHGSISQKYIFILIFLIRSSYIYPQISEGGMPHSYSSGNLKKQAILPRLSLSAMDAQQLIAEDKAHFTPNRYSMIETVDIDIKQKGLRTPLKDGSGGIWRYHITGPSARSIQLFFKTFWLSPGASLYLYNENYSLIYGAFTEKNNRADSTFIIADFDGHSVVLEYFEPLGSAVESKLVLGKIGQAYKDLFKTMNSIDEQGNIAINCFEGKNWQDQKHAVCRYTFQEGSSGFLCSGALINNTGNDGTPYFLTAYHCVSDATSALSVVAYFNYEQLGCKGPMAAINLTISGAELLTIAASSDLTLLKLKTQPPANYQPYYAGWDISGTESPSAVGIHHPNGEPKKISISHSKISSYDKLLYWEDNNTSPVNSHWEVFFDLGTTSQGSSGSPLFDNNKRIIGQLHGGDDEHSYYGKLSYSWTRNPIGFKSVKSYLDPGNTGVKVH
jgi:hypothetical protein